MKTSISLDTHHPNFDIVITIAGKE